MTRLLLPLLSMLALAACTLPAPVEPAGAPRAVNAAPVRVQGSMSYRARIALPPQALLVVELRDGASPDGALLASSRTALQGRQVPLPYVLEADAALLARHPLVTLRGAVYAGDRATWASDPVTLPAVPPVPAGSAPVVTLPDIALQTVRSQAYQAALRCGNRQGMLTTVLNELVLRMEGVSHPLRQVPAASGVAYQGTGGMPLDLRMKGDSGTLSLGGRTLPPCQVMTALPEVPPDAADTVAGRVVGREWVVESIGGQGVVDRSRATLNFDSAGRVSGSASCNSYSAGYRLSGRSLTILQATSTLRACVPALSEQEGRFLSVLRDAHHVELTADGALIVHAAGQRWLRAVAR